MSDSESSSDDDLVHQGIFVLFGMDNNDGEDAKEQVVDIDIHGWRELSNASFKENFRMNRTVFERLIQKVGLHMTANNLLKRRRIPLDIRLMMGLWPIFNPDTFRSSGQNFGKKKVLHQMAPRYIKWPTAFERENIKTNLEERYGFPGTVGAIDGTHIPITAPTLHQQDYVDRHGDYSILVQAVCDDKLLLRDVYAGQARAIGDVRKYNRSPLSLNLLLSQEMMSDDEHIIGDSAYVCTKHLLSPYVNDGHLNQRQRYQINCRTGLLKGKERRLHHLYMRNHRSVIHHIFASFVIHNFIILEGEESDGLPPINVRNIDDNEYTRLVNEARDFGSYKREYICNTLFEDQLQ
ncbi:Protein ALP1-like [Frankliniella fusca]|uniref:Protein ALP1-like n=1 Tax=Frankliniella fusca TaxID=407009 RepID=A0AAE1LBQ8_9NEOP|nr:Protein ALP1-like [Frankliniella fusca]